MTIINRPRKKNVCTGCRVCFGFYLKRKAADDEKPREKKNHVGTNKQIALLWVCVCVFDHWTDSIYCVCCLANCVHLKQPSETSIYLHLHGVGVALSAAVTSHSHFLWKIMFFISVFLIEKRIRHQKLCQSKHYCRCFVYRWAWIRQCDRFSLWNENTLFFFL